MRCFGLLWSSQRSSECLNSRLTSSSSAVSVRMSTAVAANALATRMARSWLRRSSSASSNSSMAKGNSMYHIRVPAPCSPLKIRRMRPTTLTLNPEIRMQARQSMRDIALIRTRLRNCQVILWNLPTESDKMSPIRATQSSRRNVVLIGVSAGRPDQLKMTICSADRCRSDGSIYLDGVMFNLAPVATAPAVRHCMTLTLSASRRAFVAERTTNCPELYAWIIFGFRPPLMIWLWMISPGWVCWRRTETAL